MITRSSGWWLIKQQRQRHGAVARFKGGLIIENRGAPVLAFFDDAGLAAKARSQHIGPAGFKRMARILPGHKTPGQTSHQMRGWFSSATPTSTGIFEIHAEGAEEFGAQRAVDAAMIGGEGDRHLVLDHDVIAAHHGAAFAGADGQDCGLGRIDDGGEVLDVHHAEIGDGG